jgi:DNA replication and checkpoint protein
VEEAKADDGKVFERSKKRKSEEFGYSLRGDTHLQQTPVKKKRSSPPPGHMPPTPSRSLPSPSQPESQDVTPRKPMILGPTPQKDGVILSIFDCLGNTSSHIVPGTPSRVPLVPVSGNELAQNATIPMTPSRKSSLLIAGISSPKDGEHAANASQSHSRKLWPGGSAPFVTPQKPRSSTLDASSGIDHPRTPSSISNLFATPAFLRQYIDPKPLLDALQEAEEDVMVEKSKRPSILTRARSKPFMGYRAMLKERDEIVKEQQRVETEFRMDEDEDILRELEAEAGGITTLTKTAETNEPQSIPGTQFDDIFAAALDDDGFLADDVLAELTAVEERAKKNLAGQQVTQPRIWKKKGQKRQTRRVIRKLCRSYATASLIST